HDVEPGAPALQIDDVELVLVVRRPRQRLALDAHARVRRLELAQERGQRVGGAEDARVLEHERDRSTLLPRDAATECQKDDRYRNPSGPMPEPGAHDPRSRS